MSKYYFAYGSNMNLRQMNQRCPGSRFITKAVLEGYRFVYDNFRGSNNAVANIIESKNDFVEGAIFEIDEECENNLDRCEGYPKYYQKKNVICKGVDGRVYSAFVYLRSPQPLGEPSEQYRSTVLQGARDVGLSEDYIKKFIEG